MSLRSLLSCIADAKLSQKDIHYVASPAKDGRENFGNLTFVELHAACCCTVADAALVMFSGLALAELFDKKEFTKHTVSWIKALNSHLFNFLFDRRIGDNQVLYFCVERLYSLLLFDEFGFARLKPSY